MKQPFNPDKEACDYYDHIMHAHIPVIREILCTESGKKMEYAGETILGSRFIVNNGEYNVKAEFVSD